MHQVVSIPPLIKFLSETRKHHTGDEDASAMRDLKGLAENDSRSVKRGQAGENGYGTWGYTVLRTVYTPGSDELFPKAIAKLKKWVHYRLHSVRFPMFGTQGESKKMTNPVYNDELWRRFSLHTIEDATNLSLESDHPALFSNKLCDYFREWVVSVGGDPYTDNNPRFWDCLVINRELMQSLLALSDETPPLRVAVDNAEKGPWRAAGADAFVWVLDSRALMKSLTSLEEYSLYAYREVLLKLKVAHIRAAWFYRQFYDDDDEGLPVEEPVEERDPWFRYR